MTARVRCWLDERQRLAALQAEIDWLGDEATAVLYEMQARRDGYVRPEFDLAIQHLRGLPATMPGVSVPLDRDAQEGGVVGSRAGDETREPGCGPGSLSAPPKKER